MRQEENPFFLTEDMHSWRDSKHRIALFLLFSGPSLLFDITQIFNKGVSFEMDRTFFSLFEIALHSIRAF